ncbi:hypothetical protein V5799_002218 [Amblyomma americanum]|uniref:Uncharacterized protein n=1 Tax=Amblyomma americanum TaxID=6943 RepID=A0AAQ4CXZ7_AMBAM
MYRSFTALNWAQHHVCNAEFTDVVHSGGTSVKRVTGRTIERNPDRTLPGLTDVKSGRGSNSWAPAGSSARNQHHVCNGELTDVVLSGGPSDNSITGGTVPRILAEMYLCCKTRKIDAESTPGHLPPALLATRMVYTCRPHH